MVFVIGYLLFVIGYWLLVNRIPYPKILKSKNLKILKSGHSRGWLPASCFIVFQNVSESNCAAV